METNQIRSKFEQADQYLQAARGEMNRPAEDVVPYMVCRSARNSIGSYLMGFLMKHGEELPDDVSVEVLLEKCRTISSNFNQIDLEPITFVKDEEYSAEFEKMESCIDLALFARQLAGAS